MTNETIGWLITVAMLVTAVLVRALHTGRAAKRPRRG
jgi:hypothetical protein